jgi:2-polyprenyl-6-methoxyphenol hydroxylase-like FAD-dependent oxidoreductase
LQTAGAREGPAEVEVNVSRGLETEVLIVGAGPVGLTVALDLAWRGIDVIVVERRRAGEPPRIRSNHVAARSMEIFRRLGIAKALRQAGLPADYPHDVAFRTAVTGIELTRIPIPSRARRYSATEGPDCRWPTPEPPHRINQTYLEPILLDCAQSQSRIRIIAGGSVEDLVQGEAEVDAIVRNVDSGDTFRVSCRYLVGCDGGRSAVRKKIGAKLAGTPIIQQVQSTYIRAPELLSLIPGEPAWLFQIRNPRRCGGVFAIDGREEWIVHNFLHQDEAGYDSVDRDWAIRTILGVGENFRYEVISREDWVGRRLVVDRFRDRHVFLCGDAAHLWIPNAGYGMNAGIADAANLSWLLAAVLRGWAPPAILDAYEAERRPITEQVSRFAMNMALRNMAQRDETPAEIEWPGPVGDAVRARIARETYDLNVAQFCCGGLNFGYFYAASPIIAYDRAAHPGYTMGEFTPSSVPGCRAPHVWLDGRRSLYDLLGPEFTLLRFDPKMRISALLEAATRRHVPLTILDIDAPDAQALYRCNLALVRPDQHLAWRGDKEPAAAMDLIDLVRGAGRAGARYSEGELVFDACRWVI